jgi:DNA-3-methyladenine glycosylase I
MKKDPKIFRCFWSVSTANMIQYHDTEWGVPEHDDIKLFESLILEGAQAGLTWQTILNRREGYRKAFDNFNPVKISKYNASRVKKLMQNPEIIRNKLKIVSTIQNAKSFLIVQKEFGTFDKYIWGFTNAKEMSIDLKKRGFKFVGETICYAFMQAVGMVNDHEKKCFRYKMLLK